MRLPRLPSVLRLPLFGRELMVSANNRRTYQVRVVVLVLMTILYGALHISLLLRNDLNPITLLSTGMTIDSVLYGVVVAQVALGSLVQCSTCISSEKEGGTLPLLLLTPLGPMRMVLQKFLSRLVDSASLVLLAMPLLTVGYTFGGITSGEIAAAGVSLLLVMLQFGAIGIFASCAARTSMGAMLLGIAMSCVGYGLVLAAAGALSADDAFCFVMLDLTPLGLLRTAAAAQMPQALGSATWYALGAVLPLVPVVPLIIASSRLVADWRERDSMSSSAKERPASRRGRQLPGALGVVWLAWRQSFLRKRLILATLVLVPALTCCCSLSRSGLDTSEYDTIPFKIAVGIAVCACSGFLAATRMHLTLRAHAHHPMRRGGHGRAKARFQRRVQRAVAGGARCRAADRRLPPRRHLRHRHAQPQVRGADMDRDPSP